MFSLKMMDHHHTFVMKNPFKQTESSSSSEVGKEQASPKPRKEKSKPKPKSKKKKDVGKTSSADSAQAEKILKKKKKKNNDNKSKPSTTKSDVRKEKTVKKVKAPQARLLAATKAAPTDDDSNSPGSGGELTQEQIAVLKQVLGIKTQEQLEKFRSNFTPEEISRIKKNLSDPSKRKVLQTKNADVANDDLKGFANFSGGPQGTFFFHSICSFLPLDWFILFIPSLRLIHSILFISSIQLLLG